MFSSALDPAGVGRYTPRSDSLYTVDIILSIKDMCYKNNMNLAEKYTFQSNKPCQVRKIVLYI